MSQTPASRRVGIGLCFAFCDQYTPCQKRFGKPLSIRSNPSWIKQRFQG